MARNEGRVGLATTYVVTLRKGVKWNDGKPLTAADVKFTFETGKLDGLPVRDDVEDGVAARHRRRATRSRFDFRGTPNYQEWDSNRYIGSIVPRHIWSGYSAKDIVSGQHGRNRQDGRDRAVQVRGRHRRLADAAVEPA